MKYKKVAVLMGGNSKERQISLTSGNAIFKALIETGVNAVSVDVDHNIAKTLQEGKFTSAFIIMHGRGGEDGTIQGLLEWLKIPYTGSGVLSSALAMDKIKTKQIWQALNIPTPQYVQLNRNTNFGKVINDLHGKVMVKPARDGSSIGMAIATNKEQLTTAFANADKVDDLVMAEQLITGAEYTVGIVKDEVLPIIKVETNEEFYDFDAKYKVDTTKYLIPCGLNQKLSQKLQNLTLKAYKAIGCSGWGRVDIMMDQNSNPLVLEVNTVPGMTNHSLVPKAFEATGRSFNDLVTQILSTIEGETHD